MDYIMHHTGIQIDVLVILSLILLAAVIIFFIVRRHQMIKTEKKLEDMLSDRLSTSQDPSDSSK